MKKSFFTMSLTEIIGIFVVWFHDQLFSSFPFNLFGFPLSKDLPEDLWKSYVPPFHN